MRRRATGDGEGNAKTTGRSTVIPPSERSRARNAWAEAWHGGPHVGMQYYCSTKDTMRACTEDVLAALEGSAEPTPPPPRPRNTKQSGEMPLCHPRDLALLHCSTSRTVHGSPGWVPVDDRHGFAGPVWVAQP